MSFLSRIFTSLLTLLFVSHPARCQTPPTPRFNLTAQQWQADLAFMMREMALRHKNLYHTTPKSTFDSAATALHQRIPSLARHEIILGLQRIVALAKDGHTNIYPTRDGAIGFHSLPIILYQFSDGLHIRSARSDRADLAGARVLRIGGVPAEDAMRRVEPYIGRDNAQGARFFAPFLLGMPEVLHALRLADSPDSAQFDVELAGTVRSVWLKPAGTTELMAGDTDRSWRRIAGWSDSRGTSSANDPAWLRYPPDSVLWWFEKLPGTSTVYAQVNQVRNDARETLEDFTERLLTRIDSADVDRLVLDLRLNRGGNGELRASLVRGLLRRPKINNRGHLFVLIGRSTFSAAQFLVDDLEEFSDAIFVGEPTGSKGNAYGDSRQMRLPNSGITVRTSVYYWQDWAPFDTRQWVGPEIAAELSWADYRANRDPALNAALAYTGVPTLSDQVRTLIATGDVASARSTLQRYLANPAHRYADGHAQLDKAALWFYSRRDAVRAFIAFDLAAAAFPDVVRAQSNVAALAQELGRTDRERAALRRILEIDPSNSAAAARLKALGP